MADLSDFKNYVTQVNGSTPYKTWANKNSADAARWKTYSSAVLAGSTPAPPAMSSAFGKSLIMVGIIALKVSNSVSDGYGAGYFGVADFGQ